MEINQRLDELSHEMKVLKNEIRQCLLDVREHVLTYYQSAPVAVGAPATASGGAEGVEELAREESAQEMVEQVGGGGPTPVINVTSNVNESPDVNMGGGGPV